MNKGFGNLLIEIGKIIKQYEEEQNSFSNTSKSLLKAKEVLEQYPMLTLYALNEAVKHGSIPVVKRGKLNFYDSNDIDFYIKSLKMSNNICPNENDVPRRNIGRAKFI